MSLFTGSPDYLGINTLQLFLECFYEVAKELQKEDAFLEELKFIDKVLTDNSDFMKVLKAPMISKEEKKSLIEKVFANLKLKKVKNEKR